MMKIFKLIFYLGIVFLSFNAQAQSVSLSELFSRVGDFDAKEIEVYGEVIGSPLKSDKGIWINISSGNNHLGVFLIDEKKIKDITHWGGYGQKGDFIKVKGTFNANCPLHQTSDLHLNQLEIISSGVKTYDLVSDLKRNLAIFLLLICLTMSLIYFIKERHRSKK
ncbi:MAG: hypothetical protein JW867_04965 [Candidatus Omnitrophica bacterium]|nr:hypothetical protein [Candidatus Omnitrophota bacterium]